MNVNVSTYACHFFDIVSFLTLKVKKRFKRFYYKQVTKEIVFRTNLYRKLYTWEEEAKERITSWGQPERLQNVHSVFVIWKLSLSKCRPIQSIRQDVDFDFGKMTRTSSIKGKERECRWIVVINAVREHRKICLLSLTYSCYNFRVVSLPNNGKYTVIYSNIRVFLCGLFSNKYAHVFNRIVRYEDVLW